METLSMIDSICIEVDWFACVDENEQRIILEESFPQSQESQVNIYTVEQ